MAVGHDSANNIMADKRTFRLQKKDCLPKRKRFIPSKDKEKEGRGVCVFWQNSRSTMALCSVGGHLMCRKQGEFSKVMRLKCVANVSKEPVGRFHGQHSKVSPEDSKNKVFEPVVRHAPKSC